MGGRQLSDGEIRDLITFSRNTMLANERMPSPFNKQQTLAIIEAVSDHMPLSTDGNFKIDYKNNGKRFTVSPVKPFKFTPCGNFNIEDVLSRLSL